MSHQIHRTQSVLEPGVKRPRVDIVRKTKLLDVTKSLKIRMGYNIEDEFARNGDESVDGVVNDLLFVQVQLSVNGYLLIGA